MFVHNKDLQFEVRVSRPDPRFASLLQEQFGGANGELKAAMQYFTQAFLLRRKNPKMYDLFMDIATEEFSHLEDGRFDDHDAPRRPQRRLEAWRTSGVTGCLLSRPATAASEAIHQVAVNPLYFALNGGGPEVRDSAGVPWSGTFVNANGEPTVDLRSNIAAESRAKIVYEYLKQFTDDPGVQDTLTFLMTREVTHFQQFTAALNELPVNFPPGTLPGDDRFQNVAFNMSNGAGSARGPWNEGQGPWPSGMEWRYVEEPTQEWLGTDLRKNQGAEANPEGTPAVQGAKPFTHEQHTGTS